MPQSLSHVLVHLVFSTKDRRPFLSDPVLRATLHAEIGGISNRLNCLPIAIGGVADHVHILGNLARTIAVADWVKELKRASSVWIKEHDPRLMEFAWQAGYGAFSVSESNVPSVRRYLGRQEEHHRTVDFQAEFRLLLVKHGVAFDERYVWD